LSAEKQDEIIEWGKERGFETFSNAARRLINIGLKADKPKAPKPR
jgi:hypothetical protein